MGILCECVPADLSSVRTASNLMQTPSWAYYKAEAAGWEPCFFTYRSDADSGVLLSLRKYLTGSGTAVYVPWAPDNNMPEEAQGPFLESLSAVLLPHLPASTVFIRYDLIWQTPYDIEENADLYDFDGRPPPRVREMRMNFGTDTWNLRKAPTDILPPDTVLLSLRESLQDIYRQMRAKTRYNIRLSEKKDVEVQDAPPSALHTWYSLYRETANRQGLTLHPYEDFETLIRRFKSKKNPEAPDMRLLMAYRGSEPLAGIIVALHRNHAVYLYGASSGRHRNLMAGYALQWKAISLAKQYGCGWYDLFGVSPFNNPAHPMNCLYQFKTGFGGRLIHRRGCWDYPVNHELYDSMVNREALSLAASGGYYA